MKTDMVAGDKRATEMLSEEQLKKRVNGKW